MIAHSLSCEIKWRIPNDTPVYIVCFGLMCGDDFRHVNVASKLCATEGRAMKAAQKWVNA